MRAYLAFQLPADNARAMVLLAAAVTFLLGLIIVGHWPSDSVYVLGTLLGVDLLFHGIGWATFGFRLRRAADRRAVRRGRSEAKMAPFERVAGDGGAANFFARLIVVMNGRADCG